MRRRSVLGGLAVGMGAGGQALASPSSPKGSAPETASVLASLAMAVSQAENRQFSYTDRVSGYYYARTHTGADGEWFGGWNIATKRILADYRLTVDGQALERASCEAIVSPHQIVRRHEKANETFSMLDGMTALVITLAEVKGERIGLQLVGDLTDKGRLSAQGVWFKPKEAADSVVLLAPIRATSMIAREGVGYECAASGQGFLLIHGKNQTEALSALRTLRRGLSRRLAARATRMEALVSDRNALDAGDLDRTKALLWLRLTADQLVMKQMGTGIYAGLPWFNDYWGRDTFISITGTLFVTGQYELAADVFRSFAALQDIDPKSKTYGRVPNRARPDGVQYNTADGTPRFIITLADLVSRSGNTALARELWPAVKRAVEGVLANNFDEFGLITHDDADTWMDAKEKGVRPWSPRGNRAIDIQVLWLKAFEAVNAIGLSLGATQATSTIAPTSVKFTYSGQDGPILQAAQDAQFKLRAAMLAKFIDAETGHVADHLKPDGRRDMKVRPNLFAALPHIQRDPPHPSVMDLETQSAHMRWTRMLWEKLVYPWGVATLSQDDPDFHPYHEHWHYYHKDAAYHNGTVWPWLNGDAITAMLRFEQIDLAWRLFENMNRQALKEGAVGSLAECADALPLPGAAWTRRTGTFLQAWSNAEHLRVWSEGFLGVQTGSTPGVGSHFHLQIAPKLPATVLNVRETILAGKSQVHGVWHDGGPDAWRFELEGPPVTLTFQLPDLPLGSVSIPMISGSKVLIRGSSETVAVTQYDRAGREIRAFTIARLKAVASPEASQSVSKDEFAFWQGREALKAQIFQGLDFCQPRLRPNLKSLSVRHDPPLTY